MDNQDYYDEGYVDGLLDLYDTLDDDSIYHGIDVREKIQEFIGKQVKSDG